MKKIFAAMTAALLMVALVSSTAFAGTSFKADYTYGGFTWDCSGSHVVNKNVTKDSETCIVSGAYYPLGTTTYGAGVWASDYNGALDVTFTVTEVANGNGTFTLTILATY
jgi:hypothetical protein